MEEVFSSPASENEMPPENINKENQIPQNLCEEILSYPIMN